jgi:hypothetical protein
LVLTLFLGLVKAEADWTDTLAVIPGRVLAWLVICAMASRRVPSLIRDHTGCRVIALSSAVLPLSPATLAYLA